MKDGIPETPQEVCDLLFPVREGWVDIVPNWTVEPEVGDELPLWTFVGGSNVSVPMARVEELRTVIEDEIRAAAERAEVPSWVASPEWLRRRRT